MGGSPHVPDIRPVLEATSTLVAATGILNVRSNDPGETAAADDGLVGSIDSGHLEADGSHTTTNVDLWPRPAREEHRYEKSR